MAGNILIPRYFSTPECLESVVRAVGSVRVDQLIRFFRSANDVNNLEFYIKELISTRVFDYNKSLNQVSHHNTALFKDEPVRRRIMAFWVVADFGFDNIREIYPLKYPSQLLFITEENETYDLTVCVNEDEIAAARRILSLNMITDVDDNVNHIAIMRNEETGKLALSYGFDSYCIYDCNNHPNYFTD